MSLLLSALRILGAAMLGAFVGVLLICCATCIVPVAICAWLGTKIKEGLR
jgi:hypothetical protein